MARTFTFDDGQSWNIMLTGMTYERRDGISLGARFWSDAAPDQLVLGRLPVSGLALPDADLADALRRALITLWQRDE